MKLPPIADFQEDREARIHRRSGRRAYLVALPVMAALVAVAVLGATGSKVAPGDRSRPSGLADRPASPGRWVAPTTPSPSPTPSPIYIPGLSTLRLTRDQVVAIGLPPDTLPLDADGGNFLYATSSRLYVLASNQAPLTPIQVATARPCGKIEKASLSGTEVIYSEIVPAAYSGDGSGTCNVFADVAEAADWYVSIADFGGVTRLVASGTYSGRAVTGAATAIPSVAITDAMYGFSRPDQTGESAVVEVHRLVDDAVQYKSVALALPVQVWLGDGRLVVASPGPAPVDSLAGTTSVWSTQDWAQPLGAVGLTLGPAALGRDGRRLVFAGCQQDGDKLKCDSLETFAPGVHWSTQLPIPATFVAVDSSPNSRFNSMAWISSASDGRPYIGVYSALGDKGVALVGIDQPMWIGVQDDALLWLSLTPDGRATLNRMDLLSVISPT